MTQYYQSNISRLLRESLLQLCSENVPYDGRLEIDGIVCITSGDESRPLVVKVHEILQDGGGVTQQTDIGAASTPTTTNGFPNFRLASPSLSETGNERFSNGTAPNKRNATPVVEDDVVDKTVSTWGRKRQRKNQNVVRVVNNSDDVTHATSAIKNNQIPNKPVSISNLYKQQTSRIRSPTPLIASGKAIATPPPSPSRVCTTCYENFNTGQELCKHNMDVHRRYTCDQCYNTFSMSCNLRRHQKLHSGFKPFSCPSCDSTFSRNDDLKLHLMKHTRGTSNSTLSPTTSSSSAVSSIYCSECRVLYTSKALYDEHSCTAKSSDIQIEKTFTLEEESDKVGSIGDAFTSESSSLALHVKEEPMDLSVSSFGSSAESSPQAREISIATNPTSVKSLLKDVLTLGVTKKSETSPGGSGGFYKGNSNSLLWKGRKSSGLGHSPDLSVGKKYTTANGNDSNNNDDCNVSGSRRRSSPSSHKKSLLSRHLSKTPETPEHDVRPGMIKVDPADISSYEQQEYTCQLCSEKCDGFSAFDEHSEHRHYIFPCRVCRHTFTNRNNRQRHERSHLGSKCYSCPDCGKSFTRSDILREHRITHTQAYAENRCAHCGVSIAKKAELLNHIKKCARLSGVKLETLVNKSD